jgi:hypothetical protein
LTVDEGGLAIPGVQVTISSPNLIGGAQAQTSNEAGRFLFSSLPPGIYVLEATKPGFSTVRNNDLQVLIGRNTSLTVEMPLEGTGDQIVVTDTRPTIDTEAVARGEVLSKEFLERVPTGRSYQSAVSATPGVLGGGNPNVSGGGMTENSYLIDGVNITDPVTGTFSLNFNFDAIEQLEVLMGVFDPEYPQNLGGIINIVTETGGNTLEFDTNIWVSNADWSPKLDARFAADGTELAPTGFDSTYQSYQFNSKVSGPIIRDRAWFIISYSMERSLIANVGIDLPRDYEGHYILAKLTTQPNSAHRVTLVFQTNPTTIDNTDQYDRFTKPEAQSRQGQGGWLVSPQWDWYISPELFVETKFTAQKIFIEIMGVPCTHDRDLGYHPCQEDEVEGAIDLDTPGRFGTNNAFNTDNYVNFQFQDRWRFRAETKVSLLQRQFQGSHDLKAGADVDVFLWDVVYGITGNMYFVDLNEVSYDPDTYLNYYWFEYTSPYRMIQTGYHVGSFIQDVYKPIDNLTFRYGFRYDYSNMKSDQDIAVIDMGVFGPRFFVAWDPWGDEKTVIRGGWGRFNNLGNLAIASYLSQSGSGYKLTVGEYFNNLESPSTYNYYYVPNENNYSVHDKLRAPHTDEFTIGAQREIIQDLAFGTNFSARFTENVFGFDETNRIWDEDGYNLIGRSNGEGESLFRLRTPDVARRDYYQTDTSLNKIFADRWQLMSTYSYVVSRGTILDMYSTGMYAGLSVPPQAELSYGNLPTDIRHQVKISGSYDIPNDPWTTQLGASLQYYSGYPVGRYYYSAYFDSVNILKTPEGTYARLEPVYYLDFMVQQAIKVRRGKMWAIAMLENAINAQQADQVSGSYIWYDNRWVITSRQTPMQLSLAVRYEF